MLILEAKVRKGLKPVVTLDKRATIAETAEATIDLIHAIFNQIENRNENMGFLYLVHLASSLQNGADTW